MARVCIDYCERDSEFIDNYVSREGFSMQICCCCCPVLDVCKNLDDGFGCADAKDGTYTADSCILCPHCSEEKEF